MKSLWPTNAALALALAGVIVGGRGTSADESPDVVDLVPTQEYRLIQVAPPAGDATYYVPAQQGAETRDVYRRYYAQAQPNVVAVAPADEAPAAAEPPAPVSQYWLGIQLAEVPEILRKHLSLDGGILVENVFPQSPAEKAGFAQHDILVRTGDKAIKEPADIQEAVEEAKETELTITVLRGGKETTIKATPAKRPEQPPGAEGGAEQLAPAANPELQGHIRQLEEALQGLKAKAGGDLGIWLARPGVVASRAAMTRKVEFPKNLSITIRKEGGTPAKISVKKDDKEWEVAEDKVGELPEDVRPHVQQLLGQHGVQGLRLAAPLPGVPGTAAYPHTVRVRPDGRVEGAITVAPAPVPTPAASGSPYNPATAPALAQPKIHTYRANVAGATGRAASSTDAKLDAILRKLDERNDGALEKLQNEVKQLRKELEELRGSKSEERK